MSDATVVGDAPGRVNLIGEHTDYNDGFVMPVATPQRTRVELTATTGRDVRVWSANVPAAATASFRVGSEGRRGEWIDYVQGVTVAMTRRGLPIAGFDARITSDVPLGAGLASSAALEIAFIRAIANAFGIDIDPIEAARIGHEAETAFVGAPVGIMDQIAASVADSDHALFLDTRSLAFERLRLPGDSELLVIDSGVTHGHAGGEYRVRREECHAGARRLGVAALRDATPEQVAAARLPAPLDARARHVATENARVLAARDALRAGDAAAFGALMNASHASMRDDFNVSTPEIDALVAAAQEERAVFGARLTGGGFGGSIVALVRRGSARDVAAHVAARYLTACGRTAAILIP